MIMRRVEKKTKASTVQYVKIDLKMEVLRNILENLINAKCV